MTFPRARWAARAGVLVIGLALGYRLDAPPLFDDPNDGQYAEVAREMVASGEWITPQLNFVPFLNKPPLLYWLIAAGYRAFGVHDWVARLPGVVATLLTAVLLYRLGRGLGDPLTGVLAAGVYATLPSTLIEARFVRPDTCLVAAITAALLAFSVALETAGPRQWRALLGLQLSLAIGLLAKGVVGLLLPGFTILAVAVVERRFDVLRRLARPAHWWLFAAVVVPWHAVAAARHSGFAWDYVANQHVLFFLDRKLPRDSAGIPLLAFWAALALRVFPWTLLVPLAVVAGVRAARATERRAALLALGWAGGTLGFFSAAPSRLEHYALPALPPLALLVALLLRRASGLVQGHVAITVAAVGVGAWIGPGWLAEVEWLRDLDALPGLARVFALAVSLAGVAALVLMRRVPYAPIPTFALVMLALVPLIHRGLVVLAAIDSSAPVAAVVARHPHAIVVFEAPIEYQLGAGLAFYLRRPVTLLEPPGFVDPPYLRPYRAELFIDRGQLATLWTQTPVVFVTDPLAPATRPPSEATPEPPYVLGRFGPRWVLSNRPGQGP